MNRNRRNAFNFLQQFYLSMFIQMSFQFRRGIKLRPGMTLAIEPMINIGTADVAWLDDEWTVVTQDMSLSAHYENTIIITDGKPEILTLTDSEIASHIWEP